MKKKLQIICVGLITMNLQLITHNSFSQNVGINDDGTFPESNTMLDIKSSGTTSSTFGLKVKDALSNDNFVVRSDGFVGIGTSTPNRELHLENGSFRIQDNITTNSPNVNNILMNWRWSDATQANGYFVTSNTSSGGLANSIRLQIFNGAAWYIPFIAYQNSDIGFGADVLGGNPSMFIKSDSNVGIGTTAPVGQFHVDNIANQNGIHFTGDNARNDAILTIEGTGATGGSANVDQGLLIDINSFQNNQNLFNIKENGNSKLVVKANGLVGIGTTAPSYALEVCGTIGTTAVSVTTGITCSSDKRLKKSINSIDNPLDILSKIDGKTYYWNTKKYAGKGFSNEKQFGFIAQELEEILPELVQDDADGYKSVNYVQMIPILTQAIKEQQQIINDLESNVSNLKGENNSYKAEVQELNQRLNLVEKYIQSADK